MSANEPRISVVIANYNHGHLLERCLAADLNQPVQPFEIIVVNDASTDNSLEILKGIAAKHPIVRILANERNLGVCRTMNRGLEAARGEYVLFHAADDELLPGVFEHTLRLLRQYPQAGVCSGMVEWRCAKTGMKWYMGQSMPDKPCYLPPEEMIRLGRRGILVIAGQNATFKRTALIEAGGWRPELRWFTDWFGAFVVGFRHGICHVPEVLSVFNLDPTSYYHTATSQAERRQVLLHILELLDSDKYRDVADPIRRSGIFGPFGWPIVRVLLGHPRFWKYLNFALLRRVAKRCAEVIGRRCFPDWLARFCLKVFYGR